MPSDEELKSELSAIDTNILEINRGIERLSQKKQKLLSRKQQIRQLLQENASEKLANQNWERTDHPWSARVHEVLASVFKMSKFRPYQLSTINAVMSKQDCILLMPTGGGKSLCYQLPALVLSGITLVVSPLVSLMEDQIMALEALNVPATMLNASTAREHVTFVHKQMAQKNPSLKLLYVTPEKLKKSKRFMASLEKMYNNGEFSLLAIDEVHCCSQWGHDFRTDYKYLGFMKRQFPNVPVLGLTATATSSVISDVQKILNIEGCLVLRSSFNRPNLKYEVVCKSSSQKDNIDELEQLLKNRFNGLTGIIYCFSIKDSEEVALDLKKRGIKAKAYHAQLDAKHRSSVHKAWATNEVQVIVATVAFGMGIDKPDVRFVIHYSLPKSMENFYQESGRAGRDDRKATCILFFRFGDVFRQSTMVFEEQCGLEHLYAMVAYCLDLSRCRRSIIADHFNERWESSDCNSMCDHCDKFSPYEEKYKDASAEYKTICSILEHCSRINEQMTAQKLIDTWLGKGNAKCRPPGFKPARLSRETCERIVALLLLDSYLSEHFHFTPYSRISYIKIGSRNLSSDGELLLPFQVLKKRTESTKDVSKDSSISVEPSPSSTSTAFITAVENSSKEVQVRQSSVAGCSSTASKKPVKKSPKDVELCIVNERKSHFQNGMPSSSKAAQSKKRKKGETADYSDISEIAVEAKEPEEIVLSDNELDFDDFNISRKRKAPVVLLSDSD